MPCSFSVERTLEEWQDWERPSRWSRLKAVQSGHVFAVDGATYFSRGGRRFGVRRGWPDRAAALRVIIWNRPSRASLVSGGTRH